MILSLFRKKPAPEVAATPAAPPQLADASGLSVTDAATITAVLQELVHSHGKLPARALDDRYLGLAQLLSCEDKQLTLRLTPPAPELANQGPLELELAGSSAKGSSLFTLRATAAEFTDLWQADVPPRMELVDSRRYRRIKSVPGSVHRASLSFAGAPLDMTILDLSEEGLELEVSSFSEPDWPVVAGTLALDQQRIPVPAIHRVHASRVAQGVWHVGVRLQGIDAASMQLFRRWLNVAETANRHLQA